MKQREVVFGGAEVINIQYLLKRINKWGQVQANFKRFFIIRNNTGYEHSSASFYELELAKHFIPVYYKDL